MLRITSRQALKALYSPLHNPCSNPLRGLLQARYVHDDPAPYSGPPSYKTLARRFSPSNPNPIDYFARKRAKEAMERGKFVDIRDIGGVDQKDYILITDVDHDTLQSEISELVGIPYLAEAAKDEAAKVAKSLYGFVYGKNYRMILPCVLSVEDKARWTFFIVHSGVPLTYISKQVAQAFGLKEEEDPLLAKITGYPHPVRLSPLDSHNPSINILGSDFITMHRLNPWPNRDRTVTYYIGKGWKVASKV